MFAVLSVLGGAAAFEVRKRVAETSERKELGVLRQHKQQLDKLLEDLSSQLSEVTIENENTKQTLAEVQQAALSLGNYTTRLQEDNTNLLEKQEALARENKQLLEENTALKVAAQQAERDRQTARAELEHLRDEAKTAIEEFMDGVISKENLQSRLDGLGVELKFIEQTEPAASDASDDSWLLQLRSAVDPEATARMLMFGSGLGTLADNRPLMLGAGGVPAWPGTATVCPPTCTSTVRTERALEATQAQLQAAAAADALPSQPPAQQSEPLAVADKENATEARRTVKAIARKPNVQSNSGVAFQLLDVNKQNLRVKRRQQPSMQWRQNVMFSPEPLPVADSSAHSAAMMLRSGASVPSSPDQQILGSGSSGLQQCSLEGGSSLALR